MNKIDLGDPSISTEDLIDELIRRHKAQKTGILIAKDNNEDDALNYYFVKDGFALGACQLIAERIKFDYVNHLKQKLNDEGKE